ncbi:MAG: glycosyltransferase family 39 protein [Candidatus Omnitrophota bacterium]|nr:glycosyltransferase family 39 protein [Candidatus Omnitrophota bacterium]
MKTKIPVIILLLVFAVLTISSMRQNSATCDEIAHHIPVGYVLLTKADFKMDTSQPPLPRYIVALPLKLFMNIDMPDDKAVWRAADRSVFGRDFFYKYNAGQVAIVWAARLPVVLVGVLCGLLLFVWAKALWGEKAALLSLFLYSSSPEMLAHSGLATTDMIAAFFILLSCYTFWLFLKEPSMKNAVLAGLALGLAQLSKYTAILLYPVFLLIPLLELFGIAEKLSLRGAKRRSNLALLNFFIIVLLSLIVIWAGYGFEFQPLLKDAMRVDEKLQIAHSIAKKIFPAAGPEAIRRLDDILLKVPVPLPSHMLGIIGVLRHGQEGHNTFFLGRWSAHGSPLYFVTAFLIKTPIAAIILLLAGLMALLRRRLGMGERFILIFTVIFLAVSSLSGLKLGLRHILPVYPFCFMIAGRSVEFLKNKAAVIAMALLIVWYAFSAFTAWPHYLGYFNEAVGGPANGYKYIRDSNVDWGQDLPSLSRYMEKNSVKEVVLEYFGQADPAVYGVHYRKFTPDEFEVPGNNIYAISAQYLEHAKWAKEHKPTATAGHSIFIYDFTKKEAQSEPGHSFNSRHTCIQ